MFRATPPALGAVDLPGAFGVTPLPEPSAGNDECGQTEGSRVARNASTRPTRHAERSRWQQHSVACRQPPWRPRREVASGPAKSIKRLVQDGFSGSAPEPAARRAAQIERGGHGSEHAASRPHTLGICSRKRGGGVRFRQTAWVRSSSLAEVPGRDKENIDVVDDDETEESWPFPS